MALMKRGSGMGGGEPDHLRERGRASRCPRRKIDLIGIGVGTINSYLYAMDFQLIDLSKFESWSFLDCQQKSRGIDGLGAPAISTTFRMSQTQQSCVLNRNPTVSGTVLVRRNWYLG
eukprot:COSAG02_NODE_1130_length_14395_cov_10.634373_5_plen_117_part_00